MPVGKPRHLQGSLQVVGSDDQLVLGAALGQLGDRALSDDLAPIDDRRRSQIFSTSSSRCEEMKTVRPSCSTIARIIPQNS